MPYKPQTGGGGKGSKSVRSSGMRPKTPPKPKVKKKSAGSTRRGKAS